MTTTILDVRRFKETWTRFAMLTAYDYPTAQALDQAGVAAGAGRRHPGHPVGHEAELSNGPHDTLAGLSPGAALAVEDSGQRGDGDARPPGDVVDREGPLGPLRVCHPLPRGPWAVRDDVVAPPGAAERRAGPAQPRRRRHRWQAHAPRVHRLPRDGRDRVRRRAGPLARDGSPLGAVGRGVPLRRRVHQPGLAGIRRGTGLAFERRARLAGGEAAPGGRRGGPALLAEVGNPWARRCGMASWSPSAAAFAGWSEPPGVPSVGAMPRCDAPRTGGPGRAWGPGFRDRPSRRPPAPTTAATWPPP
jgi:hypothetical protein